MRLNPIARTARFVAGLTVGAAALTAQAQQSPAAAASAASAPLDKRVPAQRTAAEVRDAATAPGERRPENPVVPQISVPLGRADKGAGPSKDLQAQRARKAAQSDGETPASCLAKVKVEDRDACMARVHRTQGPKAKTP